MQLEIFQISSLQLRGFEHLPGSGLVVGRLSFKFAYIFDAIGTIVIFIKILFSACKVDRSVALAHMPPPSATTDGLVTTYMGVVPWYDQSTMVRPFSSISKHFPFASTVQE